MQLHEVNEQLSRCARLRTFQPLPADARFGFEKIPKPKTQNPNPKTQIPKPKSQLPRPDPKNSNVQELKSKPNEHGFDPFGFWKRIGNVTVKPRGLSVLSSALWAWGPGTWAWGFALWAFDFEL